MSVFKKTNKVYLLGLKRDDTYIVSNKPLYIFDNGDNVSLCYMRDIDMMIGIRDGERMEVGIIGLEKGEWIEKYKEMVKDNKWIKEKIRWRTIEKFEIKNKRKMMDMDRGDVEIERDGIKMHWTAFKMEPQKGREYYITTPSIQILKEEFMRWD
jgi:hypothetical protein